MRWRKAVWPCRPLFCFCPMGKARRCFNSASPVLPTGELVPMRTSHVKLGPCRACSSASTVPRVRDGTFTPTPSALTEPTWAQVPAWGFGNQGWAGVAETVGSAGQEAPGSWRRRPWGTEQPARPRAQMDPRAGTGGFPPSSSALTSPRAV